MLTKIETITLLVGSTHSTCAPVFLAITIQLPFDIHTEEARLSLPIDR